jgi:membrane protease YdiL (CAAX protease family)
MLARSRRNAFLMFLLFVVASQLFEAGLAGVLFLLKAIDPTNSSWRPSLFITYESAVVVACILASLLVVWLQRRRLGTLGLAAGGALRQTLWGSLWGIVATTLLVGAIASLGGFSFGTLAMSGTRLATYALAWLAAFFGVGLAEEATFRATAQTTLGEAIGPWPAAIVLSSLFGAIHYFNKPGENLADVLSVSLLGLFMAFTVIRSGSIWFAVGFHALFDYGALYVYGAPNSGNNGGEQLPTRLLTGTYHGAPWLTGGRLGIEASWLVFPLIALLFLAYHFVAPRYNPHSPVQ